MADEKDNLNFNIYYLNFSKVYEIKMMIDNIVKSTIQREKSDEDESSKKKRTKLSSRLGNKFTSNMTSEIGYESVNRSITSSKLVESLDVIITKSTLLREIIGKCKPFKNLNEYNEGDLLKIDKIKLQLIDEETLRGILVLRRNALKGAYIEGTGLDINNFISSMIQDYSYIFKGFFDDAKKDVIIIKIPMDIENEFESKYDVSDLLIGHLSLIGVYKRVVTENFIKKNTFTFFTNLESSQQEIEPKIFPSSKIEDGVLKSQGHSLELDNNKIKYHFIDTIALIQDVHFHQEIMENIPASYNLSLFERIKIFFHIGRKKNE